MAANGHHRDPELRGDLAGRQALAHELYDLRLSGRETDLPAADVWQRCAVATAADLLQEPRAKGTRERRLTGYHCAHGDRQPGRVRGLQQVAAGARDDGRQEVV